MRVIDAGVRLPNPTVDALSSSLLEKLESESSCKYLWLDGQRGIRHSVHLKIRATIVLNRVRSLTPTTKARLILAIFGGLILIWLLAARKPWTIDAPNTGAWKLSQYVAFYLWIGALVNLVLATLLAFTALWWTRPLRNVRSMARDPRRSIPRWFWPLVVTAMAVNAWICWPRLWQSFWHDESYPIRHAILGTYRALPDGSLKLKRVSWQATFFFYKKPNHTFYSGIARACNDVWQSLAKPKGLQFSEPVIRLPAYIAGIASITTIAMLLSELEFFSAGVGAAFLSALHPWHIRYASEARAYAFVLCLIPLVIYFFLRALNNGRWRWWAAFGLAEFLLMYSYPTCVYVLVVLNVCALPAIWWRWGRTPDAITQVMRLTVSNVFAAMFFLLLMLPCVPQFLAYVKGTPGQGELDWEWMTNFLSHLSGGIPWAYRGHWEPGSLQLCARFSAHPGFELAVIFLAGAFLAAGVFRLVAKDRISALLPIVLLLPAAICFIETKARGHFINEWYLIFVLPGVIALVALGIDQFQLLLQSRIGKAAASAFAPLVIFGYGAWSAPQRHFLMTRSIQPNRESVLLTRPTLDPNDPRQENILTATFYGPPGPYDPNIISFRNAAELGELVRKADAGGKILYVNLGYLTTVEGEHQNKYALLRHSGFFEDLGLLPGFEPTMQSRHVFRYMPGSAANFDFGAVPRDRGRPGAVYSY